MREIWAANFYQILAKHSWCLFRGRSKIFRKFSLVLRGSCNPSRFVSLVKRKQFWHTFGWHTSHIQIFRYIELDWTVNNLHTILITNGEGFSTSTQSRTLICEVSLRHNGCVSHQYRHIFGQLGNVRNTLKHVWTYTFFFIDFSTTLYTSLSNDHHGN